MPGNGWTEGRNNNDNKKTPKRLKIDSVVKCTINIKNSTHMLRLNVAKGTRHNVNALSSLSK